ncbi:MAG: Gfo/Idh/MocA family oxidoreductase, partial [Candidatus Poribacteria bacterium]|nr:Gfo/Idh/MocA family oxidoreductase [Candidatus Poribacteria bacterium]
MKTYRIGILGCRGRGTAAARAYHAHPRTEIVGLCDLVQERLDTLGEEVNVTAQFTDLDEMIRQIQPDIVAIPTGTEFHYDLCMRVLEHGVNIEVEKPMCVDLVQADAVIAKAKEKGVQVAVHHQGRVGAPMQALSQAFDAGKIGDLRYMYGSGKGYYGGYGLMNIGTIGVNFRKRYRVFHVKKVL